jgi:hypothetical protein
VTPISNWPSSPPGMPNCSAGTNRPRVSPLTTSCKRRNGCTIFLILDEDADTNVAELVDLIWRARQISRGQDNGQ